MKHLPNGLLLSRGDRRELVTLIGHLQTVLESEIECHTVEGRPIEPEYRQIVSNARRRWTKSEAWVKTLSASESAHA